MSPKAGITVRQEHLSPSVLISWRHEQKPESPVSPSQSRPGVRYTFSITWPRKNARGELTCDNHLSLPSPSLRAGEPRGPRCLLLRSAGEADLQVTVYVPGSGRRAEDRARERALGSGGAGAYPGGPGGWGRPPLPPGPEVGWGWGLTRRDSLSPLRIREGAAAGREGGRARV